MNELTKRYKKECLTPCLLTFELLKHIFLVLGVIGMAVSAFLSCIIGVIISAALGILLYIVFSIALIKNSNNTDSKQKLNDLLSNYNIDLSDETTINMILNYVKEQKNRSTFVSQFSTSIIVVFSIIVSALAVDMSEKPNAIPLLLFISVTTVVVFILDLTLNIDSAINISNKTVFTKLYNDLYDLLLTPEKAKSQKEDIKRKNVCICIKVKKQKSICRNRSNQPDINTPVLNYSKH